MQAAMVAARLPESISPASLSIRYQFLPKNEPWRAIGVNSQFLEHALHQFSGFK